MCCFETAQKVPLQAASVKTALPNVSQASRRTEQLLQSHRCVALEFPTLGQAPSVPRNAAIAALRKLCLPFSCVCQQLPCTNLSLYAHVVCTFCATL